HTQTPSPSSASTWRRATKRPSNAAATRFSGLYEG
ncbi:MAG: Phosphomannomutase, partial [uncultured Rubrobacteraceae bacterium]